MTLKTRSRSRTAVGAMRGLAIALGLGMVLGPGIWGPAIAQEELSVNFRNTDLSQIIEAVGGVTGKAFLIDPRVRANNVTLISTTPMTPDEFYEAFLATLNVHGFAAMEGPDGLVRIQPDALARTTPGIDTGNHDDFVTRVVRLEHYPPQQLVAVLRPLMTQQEHMAAPPQSNVLILAGRAGNVDRLVAMLRQIDQAASADFEFIRLENASAAEIARNLGPMAQQAAQAGGMPAVQIMADPRTNSVVLSGPDSERLRYRALIASLDTPTEQGGETRVRYLYYQDAETLAERLQAQFGADPGVEAETEGGVMIWADRTTNALVYNAPSRIAQDMMAVVDQLDIRRAQVKVDAIIVEVSEQKAADLGITWAVRGSGDDTPVALTDFGGIVPGILDLGAAAATNPAAIAGALPQGITGGVGRVRDDATSWAALLTALRGDSATNIISTPTIVTLDNEEAHINVGQQVPILTGRFTGTGVQPGAPGQGFVSPFQTIERTSVGTMLRLTPQINEGDGVKLIIEQEASSIAAVPGAVDIAFNERRITTSVFIDDGDILVLGGLLDDQLNQREQRVPGLGRIPVLGALFRARNTDRSKTNLMVFIRPVIMRDRTQAAFQTNSRYNFMRELQLQQAEEGVRLMREEAIPVLPELPPGQGQSADAPVIDLRRGAQEEQEDAAEETDGGQP